MVLLLIPIKSPLSSCEAFINFLTRVFPYTDLVTGGSDLQQLDILPPHLRRAGGRVRAGAGDVLHHQECR